MRGGVGGFETTALVDGYVYEYRTGFHHLQHFAGDEVWGLVTGDEDGTDYQVDVRQFHLDVMGGRIECLYVFRHHFTQVAQAGKVDVGNQYLGTHSGSYLCGIGAHDTTSKDKYACGTYARYSAHQFSLAALWLFKEAGSYLGSHTSCHLAHGGKQRK